MNATCDRKWGLVRVVVCAGVAVIIQCTRAWAQDSPPSATSMEQLEKVTFAIPAQGLRSALTLFMEQSGWRLHYNDETVEGRQGHGVAEAISPETALKELLAGTDIGVRIEEPRTAVLTSEPTSPSQATSLTTGAEKSQPVKMPEIMVKDVKERGYVAEAQVTATKSDIPLIETPQSITVITRKRMDTQEVNTMAGVLRYTAGVQAETFEYEPRFTWLRFRGFDATTDGLFKDGLQLRNPGFALGYSLEPYGAEQVDILRGPASFLYGQGSPGGLLNYISKRPATTSLRELQFLVGNFGRYEGRMDLGGRLTDSDTFSYRLTGLFRESGTQFDHVPNDRVYIASALTWRINSDMQITFFRELQEGHAGQFARVPR